MSGDLSNAKSAIIDDYRKRTPGSETFFAEASSSLLGGVTGNLRYFEPYPLYFETGQGAHIRDIDGNEYIDCFLCNGPLLLGHRHPDVIASIREHEPTGLLVVNPKLAAKAAQQLQDLIPCAERVRFVNSGTEAVITAIRCARAATGRNKLIKFAGHYHGQFDQVLVGIGRSPRPLFNGIPDAAVGATTVLPYNDIDRLRETLETDNDIAAILLDPVMHSGGLWGSTVEFLQEVRKLTRDHDVVLIFDEVISGLRLGLGGAQEYYGVVPDLATFAKALSAGEKIGAIVGREDVMAVLDPRRQHGERRAYQSGTANDGTIALAATLGAIKTYRNLAVSGDYDRLFSRSKRLAEGLRKMFAARGVPCHVNQIGPMLQMYLTDAEPSFETFSRVSVEPLKLFTLAMLSEGVLFALPGSTHVYLSFCHSDAIVDQIIEAAGRVLDRYDFAVLIANG